jgi:hypothetical protein
MDTASRGRQRAGSRDNPPRGQAESVRDAIADTADEAASLKLRADLMEQIATRVDVATAFGCRVRMELKAE